jgi:hypothetical protein
MTDAEIEINKILGTEIIDPKENKKAKEIKKSIDSKIDKYLKEYGKVIRY